MSQAHEFAQMLADMARRIDRLEKGGRVSQANHTSWENVALPVYDADGNLRQRLGRQSDGTFTNKDITGPPPPQPTDATWEPLGAAVLIHWDGEFVADRPADFRYVEIQASPTSGFIPGPETKRGVILDADGDGGDAALSTTETLYVRLVAVSTSGARSTPSAEVVATPGDVVADEILDGVVTELKLADDAVTAAKIAADAVGTTEIADDSVSTPKLIAGSVETAKIAADAVAAGKIAADAVTAREINALAVTADEIAANAVTAGKIAAGSVDAAKLAAEIVLASRIYAPTSDPHQWHLEIGDPEKPIHWLKGSQSGFYLEQDPLTGKSNTFTSGRVQFGESILENDIIDLDELNATGFDTPSLRQQETTNGSGALTSIGAEWSSPTVTGNLLLAVVTAREEGGGPAPGISAPAEWTLVDTVANGALRTSLFYIPAAGSHSGRETFTLSTSSWCSVALGEYAGIDAAPLDQVATNSGVSDMADTGTTATTTQANELWFAMHAWETDVFGYYLPSDPFTDIGGARGSDANGGIEVNTRLAGYNATATGTATATRQVPNTFPWGGLVATFKARPAVGDPAPPSAGKARLYVREDHRGVAQLNTIDSEGTVRQVSGGVWLALPLVSGYEAFSAPPEYRIVGSQVWLRGGIQRTDGTAIPSFTEFALLPADAAPAQQVDMAVGVDHAGPRTYSAARLILRPDGRVEHADQDPNGLPLWLSLDGAPYWTD